METALLPWSGEKAEKKLAASDASGSMGVRSWCLRCCCRSVSILYGRPSDLIFFFSWRASTVESSWAMFMEGNAWSRLLIQAERKLNTCSAKQVACAHTDAGAEKGRDEPEVAVGRRLDD